MQHYKPSMKVDIEIRDYFAAAALMGILANPITAEESIRMKTNGTWKTEGDAPEAYSSLGYVYADAMLEARDA